MLEPCWHYFCSWALLGRSLWSLSRFFARFSRFVGRSWPPGLDFRPPGRSRASFWEPKCVDFRAFSLLARVRCKLPATSKKYCKNQYETHFGACARRRKIDEKSLRARVRWCSMLQTRSDTAPGRSGSVCGAAQGRFWTSLGRSWPARGVSRSAFGRHLAVHKPS